MVRNNTLPAQTPDTDADPERKVIALPASKRRRKRHLARREEMVDAAMEIVLEKGLEHLTIKRLADRLEAAVGAIYRYFPGKAELIADLQQRAIEGFHKTLREDLEAFDAAHKPGPASDCARVATVCFSYLSDRSRFPERHALLDAVLSAPDMTVKGELAMELTQKYLFPLLQTAAEPIVRATDSKVLDEGDAMLRTHLIWAVAHGLDHFQKRDVVQPPEYRLRVLTRAMLRTLLIGWGAKSAVVDEGLN